MLWHRKCKGSRLAQHQKNSHCPDLDPAWSFKAWHLFLRGHGIMPRLSCLLWNTRPYHSQVQRLRGRVLCWPGPGRGTEISVSKGNAEAFPTGAKCLGLLAKDRRGQRNQGQEPAHSGRRWVYQSLLQPHIHYHAQRVGRGSPGYLLCARPCLHFPPTPVGIKAGDWCTGVKVRQKSTVAWAHA